MLFVTKSNRPIDRSGLLNVLHGMGERAAANDVHPHSLRQRFSLQYLRNGKGAYTLQALPGHSTLNTVKTYLQLARAELDEAHRRADPVDNWAV